MATIPVVVASIPILLFINGMPVQGTIQDSGRRFAIAATADTNLKITAPFPQVSMMANK